MDQFLTVIEYYKFTDTVQANLGGVAPFEALAVASLAQMEAFHDADVGKITPGRVRTASTSSSTAGACSST